ncbi:MAG: glycosyltransferase family 39 protein [Gallionella sp.]|jgi:4-amino-4-deoxy-L-arabinose transferase-like glycosyltransferase|nr:glycosyltransferase family 39 protein [Gallionella sp.]
MRSTRAAGLFLLFALALVWFANLEYRTLIKPDEGRYAEIPREMVVSGDWVTPRLNELKYFEKPPLQYWATATAYTLFGDEQWTSRLWAALTGFAGILLVWLTGVKLFGREAAGYAALILSSSLLYVLMAHINTLDMGVTFFITLGIAGLLIAQNEAEVRSRRRWMLVAWAGLALAVLSKGLMGIVLPGAALFIYCLVQRDFSVLKRMHWLPGLALFFAIVSPWFYLVMKANPEFFERFFIYEHYTRFTTKDLGRYQPWHYFIPILLAGALPWTVTLLDSMRRGLDSVAAGQFNASRFLLIWAIFIYLFFSISGSKLPSYLLPMFPALALLMGRHIVAMRSRTLFWQLAPALLMPLLLIVLASIMGRLADTPNQAALYPHYAPWLFVAAVVGLAGLGLGLRALWRGEKFSGVLAVAVAALLTAQIGLSGYESIARERSARHIAEVIHSEVSPEIPFYSVLTYEQTLAFYLKHTFTLVQYQDEMAYGIQQEPQRYIPTLAAFASAWNAQPRALAIMPSYAYPQIQQLGISMQIIFQDTQHIVVKKP